MVLLVMIYDVGIKIFDTGGITQTIAAVCPFLTNPRYEIPSVEMTGYYKYLLQADLGYFVKHYS